VDQKSLIKFLRWRDLNCATSRAHQHIIHCTEVFRLNIHSEHVYRAHKMSSHARVVNKI